MAQIITYSEVNSKLETSYSPINRCACKWDAVKPGAGGDDVYGAGFANNRLITKVEKTAPPAETYTVRFFNEDGTQELHKYEDLSYGDTMPSPTPTPKEGWIASWIPQPMPATVTGDADFYLHYDIDDPHTGDIRQYFTTHALQDGVISLHLCQEAVSNVSLVKYRVGNLKRVGNEDIPVFDDPEWEEFITQGVPATINVPVRAGNIIQWRGNGSRYSYGYHEGNYSHFSSTCNFEIMNNLLTLLYDTDIASLTEDQLTTLRASSTYCFGSLFAECDKLINADKIAFPRRLVGGEHHFTDMFRDCVNLTSAAFIAGSGAMLDSAYERMFLGCTSLTKAPTLPSTELGPHCYQAMFSGCTSLVNAPELPATNLVKGCYDSMFGYYTYDYGLHSVYAGCISLKNITMRGTYYGPGNEPQDWWGEGGGYAMVMHPLKNWVQFKNASGNYAGQTSGNFYGSSSWQNVGTDGSDEYVSNSIAGCDGYQYIGVPNGWTKH